MKPCGHELPWHQHNPVQCATCGLWYQLAHYNNPETGETWVGWTPMPGQEAS